MTSNIFILNLTFLLHHKHRKRHEVYAKARVAVAVVECPQDVDDKYYGHGIDKSSNARLAMFLIYVEQQHV
jgi:hypothetical protein